MTKADDKLKKRTKLVGRKQRLLLRYRPLNTWEDAHPKRLRVKYRRKLDDQLLAIQRELRALAVS